MPSCLRQANIGSAANAITYLYDIGGGQMTPQTRALVLVPDTVTTNLSQCAAVSISGAEYLALQSGAGGADPSVSPFAMSAEDGALISASIIGVWVAAYLIRSVINVVQKGTES